MGEASRVRIGLEGIFTNLHPVREGGRKINKTKGRRTEHFEREEDNGEGKRGGEKEMNRR